MEIMIIKKNKKSERGTIWNALTDFQANAYNHGLKNLLDKTN